MCGCKGNQNQTPPRSEDIGLVPQATARPIPNRPDPSVRSGAASAYTEDVLRRFMNETDNLQTKRVYIFV